MFGYRSFFAAALILFLFIGCGKQQSEKAATADPHAMGMTHGQSAGMINYKAPEGWVSEKPASSMRKAQYRIPGKNGGGDAELAVFNFPGTGGSTDANIQRWYGQFKHADGQGTGDDIQKEKVTANGLDVTLVYFTGTYLQSKNPNMMMGPKEEKPGYALLAAIVDVGDSPLVFQNDRSAGNCGCMAR